MRLKAFVKERAYDILARRRDPAWRAMYVPDLSSIRSFGIYHVNGKLGDTAYLAMLAQRLRYVSGKQVITFTTKDLAPYWKAINLDVKLVLLDVPAWDKANSVKWQRLRNAQTWRHRIDCLITLDSGEDLRSVIDFRIIAPRLLIGGGKDSYALFNLTFPEIFHTTIKQPMLQKVRYALQILGMTYEDPQRSLQLDDASIFVNSYGATRDRSFTLNQVLGICHAIRQMQSIPAAKLIVSVPPETVDQYKNALAEAGIPAEILHGLDTGGLAMQLKRCRFCITPDTGVAHVAATLGTPTLVFFASAGYHPLVWRPDFPWVQCVIPDKDCPLPDIGDNFFFAEQLSKFLRQTELIDKVWANHLHSANLE